ncbi:receptor-type tyrosine-protein phosphatase alpha-like [Liolophura sinensis]|uniref:receptor-type tyrosine-protein phosphatase alpha-like n=1 Tax=Liolophura sinensis TaxID=3198878 RepID=UPI003158E085
MTTLASLLLTLVVLTSIPVCYGQDCNSTSTKCGDECHCVNRTMCGTAGFCEGGCQDGWTSSVCQTKPCLDGKYGDRCQNTCSCANRQTTLCDKATGTCTGQCNPGYTGEDCQTKEPCPDGKYGDRCQNTCSCANRQTTICDKATGTCTGQCNPGYTGQNCQTKATGATDMSTAALSSSTTGAIVGGVLGFVVILALVVVVVIFLRRRRRSARRNSESDSDNIVNRPIIVTDSLKVSNKRGSHATNSVMLTKVIGINELVTIVGYCDADPEALADEFENLPGGVSKKSETAFLPQHAHKCRYKGMVPYDHSRVVLEPRDSDPYSDFINASYIDIKCDQYWPESGSTVYGHVTVELLATHQFEDFCVRTLTVRADGKVRTLKQFHFTHWGDHDAPSETTGVISLLTRVQEAKDEGKGPIVVHCSAGVGRTGTYIALDILLEQARAENQVDIPKYVTRIRSQRANMIQTQGQFTFLHRVLLDAWVGADSIVTTPEFAQQSTSYFRPVPPNNVPKIQSEFEALEVLQNKPSSEAFKAACTEKNISKNRDPDHLPPDISRTFLSTYIPGRTDYINAVYLRGYENKFAYISTQMPLPDTIIDFWRLVLEQRSSTIIMLNTGQNELMIGSAQLMSGSVQLMRGSVQLMRGSAQLMSGSVQLMSGSVQLISGSVQLMSDSVRLMSGSVCPADEGFCTADEWFCPAD